MTILNFVFFQALWFSCVVAAGAYSWHWLALASILPISLLSWFGPTRQADFAIAFLALAIGLFIDNLWVALGILAYPDNTYAPYWIGVLWYGLGLTINHSMALFRDNAYIGSLVVGVFAPVTYLTGQKFGSVAVQDLWMTSVICVTWFVVFLGLSKLALRLISKDTLSVEQESLTFEN